ncbi:hypothetical protein NSK11_contig00231-0001 [Nocardia seriolae]|uniref:Uncharacterized protein n=1 Tax=Nocardia seriolae TaxID=37332 RepID=A0ABC9Z851_9NOCA|nr:hypothetical protein NS07_v2contig00231-0001 [Nocardia seriolae]GAP33263.1 hypothetical protein NSK11_contig00231-0001 [Nocardia seriolae]
MLSAIVATGTAVYNHPSASTPTQSNIPTVPSTSSVPLNNITSVDQFRAVLPKQLAEAVNCEYRNESDLRDLFSCRFFQSDGPFSDLFVARWFDGSPGAYPTLTGAVDPNSDNRRGCGPTTPRDSGDAEVCFVVENAETWMVYKNKRTGLTFSVGSFKNQDNGVLFLMRAGL